MKIGYQGIAGAYSEMASRSFFQNDNYEYIGYKNFEDIYNALEDNTLDYGVLPIENSLAGSIHKNIDLLNKHNFKIVGEKYLKISHNLMSVKGADLGTITDVYSHWQALAQCEDNIKKTLPNAKVNEYFDTAGSAEYVSKTGDISKAAIASQYASKLFNLEILQSDFQDDKNNYTRFVILNKSFSKLENDGVKKFNTSITFSGKNVAGFLFKVLKSFADRNINLTKIESRPKPKDLWNYFFYVDFEGKFDDLDCAQALAEVLDISSDLKVLGSYERGEME